MSSQEEYSSDEEELLDSKSDVFLGYVDGSIDDDEPTIEDTFLGGSPVWLHPESQPKKEDLECDNCHKEMALLMQAFAPMDGKPYDRVIYIFGCKNTAQCSKQKGSIKAIRGVSKDPERIAEILAEQAEEARKLLDDKMKLEDKKMMNLELTKGLFGGGAAENPFGKENPFGASESPFGKTENDNPFGAFQSVKTEKAKSEKPESEKPKSENAKQSFAQVAKAAQKTSTASTTASTASSASSTVSYPGYFLYIEQETFKKHAPEPELEKYKHLIDKMEPDEDGPKEKPVASLNPQTSKISSMLDDKHFENFTSVVGHNSSQVLRYDLGGKPLLYSGRDDVAKVFGDGLVPDPAYNPSSSRQFELQLMPKAIIDLEKNSAVLVADILNGMAWGTIIVATDVEDYVPELDARHVGYVREWCGVQWEESV